MATLSAEIQVWPIAGAFVISRGAKREAVVVQATISEGGHVGRGECVPYGRYGETPEGVLGEIEKLAGSIAAGLGREELQHALPAGAARNALDCALWDLEAVQRGCSVADLAGFERWDTIRTAYTISLASASEMAERAARASAYPLLKLKLGGDGDADRMRAVRAAVPGARLTVDANEAWSEDRIEGLLGVARDVGVEMVEQPLPADRDKVLGELAHDVPICADESLHTHLDVVRLVRRYDVANIKLDKAGGLSEALLVMEAARANGMKVMVGCMLATSLSMAPAHLLAQNADWVDLDGPLLLARDRSPGLAYDADRVAPPGPGLWGGR